MTNCKACNKEIAKGVKKCPNCGKDQRNFFMRHKILTGILVFVILASIGGGKSETVKPNSGGNISTNKNIKVESDDKEVEGKTEFSVDEIISYNDFDLIFTNQRTISGISDSEYIVLDVIIESKKDNFNFIGDIQGVTDSNEVVEDTIALISDDIGDPIMTAWTKTLNKGQKATGYVAFDREINKIEVRSNQFLNDVISIILD